jgi:hypothetical protein
MISHGDQLAAAFLRSEPQYTERSWIDTYANCIGRCKPELSADQAVEAARQAFAREASWNNPKLAAGCDALFGPLEPR